MSMTGFVDDTKGQTNDQTLPHPMLLQQLIAWMQAIFWNFGPGSEQASRSLMQYLLAGYSLVLVCAA
jgi:hypothetical protein